MFKVKTYKLQLQVNIISNAQIKFNRLYSNMEKPIVSEITLFWFQCKTKCTQSILYKAQTDFNVCGGCDPLMKSLNCYILIRL
jgi:hypothetical protein